MKGNYRWKVAQKREVLAKFSELQGITLHNGKKTEFGAFTFCRTGRDAGAAWVQVHIPSWGAGYLTKRDQIAAFIKSKFGSDPMDIKYPNSGAGAKFKFYPFGFPKVEIDDAHPVNRQRLIDYCARVIRSYAIGYRFTMSKFMECISELGHREECQLVVTHRNGQAIIERVQELFDEQKERDRRYINHREIVLQAMRDEIGDVYMATLRPGHYATPDKTVVRQSARDDEELFRLIRSWLAQDNVQWSDDNSRRVYLDICESLLCKLLLPVETKVSEADEAAPAPSFLND